MLYDFCRQHSCADGAIPDAALVAGNSGYVYGTTEYGGSTNCFNGCGTTFRLAPDGTETVLYSFCADDPSCPDGELPNSPLVFDSSGNIYGTTTLGGTHAQGTIFKISADGKESVLYSFCAKPGCADGADPSGGIIMESGGDFYGATRGGGTACTQGGCGTIFRLSPSGREKVLYSFCSKDLCADGMFPNGGLIMGENGDLYGTTEYGGASADNCAALSAGNFCGTVFRLSATGVETVLYSFCAQAYCTDGAVPQSGVVMDRNGNLYGTASGGGNMNQYCPTLVGGTIGSCGVVFEIKPDLTEVVLHTFCTQPDCTDGAFPLADLTLKPAKAETVLYGTAEAGGAQGVVNGAGVVFSLSGDTEKVLHSFCSRSNCADGEAPQSGVILNNGWLVGATWVGGKFGSGVIYKLDRSHRSARRCSKAICVRPRRRRVSARRPHPLNFPPQHGGGAERSEAK